ncbi:YaaA family protein [Agromyces sp. NPDC056523]|uniref:YaaA family protein n=1 Tax=Agromyces sp. NPDC056523 TaxID=3345850 RepID=UPI00366E3B0F
MLLLLPPSETKRDGGDGPPLELSELSFSSLRDARATVLDATVRLAADSDQMMRALKLGPRQAAEVDRNRRLSESPTMPAIDRYTGVLYDALDAPSLDAATRSHAGRHVAVHSALLGLVGARDRIPAYRLSHDSRLPGLRLKAHWREPIGAELQATAGLVVDLRSEGYAELGPAPQRPDSVFVRVVTIDEGGRRRALNHFNKRAKGLFARALLDDRADPADVAGLLAWARGRGIRLEPVDEDTAHHELHLVA